MLQTQVLRICAENSIRPEAVELILEGLKLAKPPPGTKHIRGQDLCHAIKDICLDRYGALAAAVLETYDIRSTRDIGLLVFRLIECKLLGKSDNDSLDDFTNVFKFDEVFDASKYIKSLPL